MCIRDRASLGLFPHGADGPVGGGIHAADAEVVDRRVSKVTELSPVVGHATHEAHAFPLDAEIIAIGIIFAKLVGKVGRQAVSYTHLDVYKRQSPLRITGKTFAGRRLLASGINWRTPTSVSITS